MKQAKASVEEAEELLRWLEQLDEEARMFRANPPPEFRRVIFGYLLMLEHCADPDQDVLDFKPEIAAAMSSFKSAREDGA
jgi:hypothetical protein